MNPQKRAPTRPAPGYRIGLIGSLAAAVCAFAIAACGGGGTEPTTTSTTTGPATTGSGTATTSASTKTSIDGQPVLVVESPSPQARVTSPITISGNADVYEATVTIIILDVSGKELVHTFTTATCGSGCRGTFDAQVPFEVSAEQPGTVRLQEDNAAGGSPIVVVDIPVTLAP